MTNEELSDLDALCAVATPGPWTIFVDEYRTQFSIAKNGVSTMEERLANIKFIAASRTAIPELIKEVRRLRERI